MVITGSIGLAYYNNYGENTYPPLQLLKGTRSLSGHFPYQCQQLPTACTVSITHSVVIYYLYANFGDVVLKIQR